MNIALIGYGKMGKAIEEIIVEEKKHSILFKIGQKNIQELTVENLQKVDVAIDFTQPDTAYDHVMLCFEAGIPIVVGTTSWEEGLEKAKLFCLEHNQTLFTSPNFSIGVNIFFHINQYLAQIMSKYPEYGLTMSEIHHTQKKDAPSGTAIHLAKDIILEKSNDYDQWHLGTDSRPQSIPIDAIREENVPGTHHVKYESPIDFINITHEAKGRKGFAIGAVRAAEFVYGKKGFFTMNDLLSFNS